MGQLTGTPSGGTPPYSFVVRKEGESSGNRCSSNCNSLPLDFTHDAGNNKYYFIMSDSSNPPCVLDSREITGGFTNLNCDVIQPTFNATLIQPMCNISGGYTQGRIELTGITNGARYKICYNTTTFNCADCTATDGTITSDTKTILLDTPTTPTSKGVLLRVYKDSTCDSYKEFFGTMVTPVCSTMDIPDFEAEVIAPYCSQESGGTVQNATLKLKNVTNGTRYKICYNTNTFNCNSQCTNSDGLISGSAIDISISAPAENVVQNNVIRVYNGSGCDYYLDFPFSIRSPKCSIGELTMMNLDLQVFQNGPGATSLCDRPNTYHVEYDFYVTPNTPGMSENNTQVKTGNTSQRTLPSGNQVPNVYVAASYKPLCGGTNTADGATMLNMFYRFSWNMSYLKAKYPTINEFIFDVFALKTKDDGLATFSNSIRPVLNAFTNVAMERKYYSNNAQDANRYPFYDGSACRGTGTCTCPNPPCNCCSDPFNVFTNTQDDMSDVNYNPNISGHRKIGTIKYNYTTNQATWIPS